MKKCDRAGRRGQSLCTRVAFFGAIPFNLQDKFSSLPYWNAREPRVQLLRRSELGKRERERERYQGLYSPSPPLSLTVSLSRPPQRRPLFHKQAPAPPRVLAPKHRRTRERRGAYSGLCLSVLARRLLRVTDFGTGLALPPCLLKTSLLSTLLPEDFMQTQTPRRSAWARGLGDLSSVVTSLSPGFCVFPHPVF